MHARKHPHPQPPSLAHTRVQTHTAGETRAHTSVDGREHRLPGTPTTAGPAQEEGLLRLRLPPDSFQRMFPNLACQVSGERASEMQQEPLGGKLELTVPCLALPANSLTGKLFVARARVAGEPPATSPPVLPPRAASPRPLGSLGLQLLCPAPRSRACRRASPLICAVWTARVGKAGFSVPAESTGRPRAAGLFLSYQCRNAAAAAAATAAAAWAVGRQGSPEGAPSPLRSSRSVREPSRTQRGELEGKKRQKRERKRKRERE